MSGFHDEPTTLVYEARLDAAGFLRWVTRQEGRFELKDGEIVVHPGGSVAHAKIIGRLIVALAGRLDQDLWHVCPTDLAIVMGDTVRYPDVVVCGVGQSLQDIEAEEPVVLIEVLSPSSVGTDMTVKLAEYTSLASLEAYVVASQDEPIVWVWQRAGEGRAFPAMPTEIAGREGMLALDGLGITIALADVYRGIGTG